MSKALRQAFVNLACRNTLTAKVSLSIAAHATYEALKKRFIQNGKTTAFNEDVRASIVARFERIDQNVPIGSTPTDGLFLAEMMLNMQATGDLVECGCYAGGSSAKLSIIASLLGRRLTVFDSFEGLPAVADGYLRDLHCRRGQDWVTDWTAGRYAAQMDAVKANIEKYGEISVCSFVKGWFSDTLAGDTLPGPTAFAFVDVDLANSATDCLMALWPCITDLGIYVTHDAAYIGVLLEMFSPERWRKLGSAPPILFGAGYGLDNQSPHLGYMVKGEKVSADYLKALTINK